MQAALEGIFNIAVVFVAAGSLAVWCAIVARWMQGGPALHYERRRSVPWRIGEVALAAISAVVLELLLVDAASRMWGIDLAQNPLDPHSVAARAVSRLPWLAAVITLLWKVSGARRADMGLTTDRLGSDLRLGALCFLGAAPVVYGLQALFVYWMPSEHPLVKTLKVHQEPWVVAVSLLTAVVVAPLTEEFMFRVVLQGWLEVKERQWRRYLRKWRVRPGFLPIAISSLVFASLHAGHGPDPVPIFMLAVFLGYLYRQTHRLWPSLAAHLCLNASSMMMFWIGSWLQKNGGP